MSEALRNAVAELRREAADLREQADKRDTAATTLETLLDEGRIPAPAQQRARPMIARQPSSAPGPETKRTRQTIDLAAVKRLMDAGKGAAAIACEIGCSVNGAMYAMGKVKGQSPPHAKPAAAPRAQALKPAAKVAEWSAEDTARLKDLRAGGMTWRQVSEKLGKPEADCIQHDMALRRAAEKAREAKLNGAQA